jgi:hypothetical protein
MHLDWLPPAEQPPDPEAFLFPTGVVIAASASRRDRQGAVVDDGRRR